MKEKIRKIIAFILTVIITISATLNSTKVVEAATFDEINQTEVFLKQNTNYTCTLVSAVMMVRRAAMATGNSNWKNITESTMRGTAWLEETGLSWSFSYAGITVKHDYLSGGSGNINQLISLLKTHPEGIVIYDSDVPHAILITDYTNGTFYCADPGKNIASGRIPVSSAYISVTNADAYWYVSSPAVTVTNTITLWGVDEGKVVDVPQYLWAKRFDDDSNHFAEFYMDGNLLTGYLTADENGYYSVWIDPQDYTEGNHIFSVKYFNTNGSWTDSRTICIVSDKVAPDASEKKISLWGIDEGKIVDVPQYLWAKRFDDDSNHFAEFYMDGNLLTGHLTADENGYYSVWIEPQDYADGNHIFSVKYFNTNGSWTDSRTICIVPDTEPPVITNVKVTDVTSKGYIVTCNVTDDKCLNRVQFPTWSLKNGQDDLIEDWWSNPTVSGTMNGSQVTFRVSISEHNNESGEYATHIYAIDSYANRTTYEFIVTVPEMETEVPTPTETEEVTPIPTVTEEVTPTPTETEVETPTPTPTKSVTEIFTDVYDDWYTSYVQYVFDHGLMTGIKGTTEFQPNANITKAQVAQVLYNMENQPTVNDKKAFTDLRDVYAAEWYANAVAWAYNTGVVTGDLNTKKFSPNANVTREQLALMLYRYADFKNYSVDQYSDLNGLKNAENVSNWAAAGVKWAVGAGLISGIDKNGVKDLAPQGNANRAQVAAILQRFCEAYNN